MANFRLIARLDIKGPNLIKGVHFEGLRVIGPPNEYALDYYFQGADELIYMDTVASLYGRNHLSDLVQQAARNIFIPLTVGGGIRSLSDVESVLRSGADKVAINTAVVRNPQLITDIARHFGSQCAVLSIEAKCTGAETWEVYIENGREPTGINVVDWVKQAELMGAGEVLLTSIDQEGTGKGFDIGLMRAVTNVVSIPVIGGGGMGRPEDLIDAFSLGGVDAISVANVLHYKRYKFSDMRQVAKLAGIKLREYEENRCFNY